MAQANPGQATLTGSAQQMPNVPSQLSVMFYALSGNSGTVYIGNSSSVSSSNGFPLEKGTAVTFPIGVGNANQFWFIGTSSDKIGYAVV